MATAVHTSHGSTRSGDGWRVLAAGSLLVVAAAGAAWASTVTIGHGDTFDADHLWRPAAWLDGREALVGALSAFGLVAAGAALVADHRAGRLRAPWRGQLVVLTAFALWLGMAYAVVTAPVVGANIGGGLFLLLTPIVAAVALGLVAGMAIRVGIGSARRS